MWQFYAVVALAAAAALSAHPSAVNSKKYMADKEFLKKQKDILEIVYHVQQPLLNSKLIDIAESYNIDDNKEFYKGKEIATKFWKLWLDGEILARGEEFSPVDMKWQIKERTYVFIDLLIAAKNWENFYKTAVWARQNINEGMFLYSLSVAMYQRPDTKDLMLPPMFELMPQMFFRSEVMHKAYEARMLASDKNDKTTVGVDSHFYNWFHSKMMPENRMSYFSEDISLNAWNWEMQTRMDAMLYKWNGDGDSADPEITMYYPFIWKWMINRYNLEKMSNNLPEMERLRLNNEMDGFVPHLRLKNGKEIPMRPKGLKLVDLFDMEIDEIKYAEDFIKWIFEREGQQGAEKTLKNGKAPILKYISNLKERFLNIIGRIADPKEEMNLPLGTTMYFETQLRDPLYYQMLLRMTDFVLYVAKPQNYQKDDLLLPGVKIESMETDKLITFYENYDVELNNGLEVRSMEDDKRMTVVAHHSRLNYKPFEYKMMVGSKDSMRVMIRVFLAPMRDLNGINMTLQERAPKMVEIDRFEMDLTSGMNKIDRSSKDFTFFKEDKDSFKMMYKKVDDAIQGKAPFYVENTKFPNVRYPANLLFPKGKKNGLSMAMFAVISTIKTEEKTADWIGFPFDSSIDFSEMDLPNMMTKEIFIYHKKTDEMFETL